MSYSLNTQPFSEESLPLPYDSQFRAKVGFNTTVIENSSGKEQRFPNLMEYQLKCDLSDLILTGNQANQMVAFFRARKGSQQEFRFRFWADCTATATPWVQDERVNAFGDTFRIQTQGRALFDQNDSSKVQLVKSYEIENVTTGTKQTTLKTITKPIPNDNFKIFIDGVERSGDFTLNTALGTVEFTNTIPAGTEDVTWTGEFELPVRFQRDTLPQILLVHSREVDTAYADDFHNASDDLFRFDSLPVVEEPKQSTLDIDYGEVADNYNPINIALDFGFHPGLTISDEFGNYEKETANNRTFRENRQNNKPKIEFEQLILNQAKQVSNETKADALLTYFTVAKGRLLPFTYDEFSNVRFDSDDLEIEPLARLGDYESTLENVGYFKLGFNNVSLRQIFQFEKATFWFVVDSTSINEQDQTEIIAAIEELKTILTETVFGGNQTEADLYLKDTIQSMEDPDNLLSGGEAWMQWFTDLGEEKAYYFFWMDESNDVYHGTTDTDTDTAPTLDWDSHFSNFKSYFPNRETFRATVYHVDRNVTTNDAFRKHLSEAYLGNNGYTSVKPYGIEARLDVQGSTTAQEYFNDFYGLENVGTSPETILLTGGRINPLAKCVLITRDDGVQIGFTNHSRNLVIDGVTYRANEAVAPTAVESKPDLSINNSEIESVLNTNGVSEADIVAGKYRNAEVIIFLVDFTNLPATPTDGFLLQKGLIGQITTDSLGYNFEIMSKADTLLGREASKRISPTCPYTFGDSDCGVDTSSLTQSVTVSSQSADTLSLTFNETLSTGINDTVNYSFGIVTFTSGLNNGLSETVFKQIGSNTVQLFKPMPYLVQTGDTLDIVQGCPKSVQGCRAYNNIDRFGGFPTEGNYMPGNDFIISAI